MPNFLTEIDKIYQGASPGDKKILDAISLLAQALSADNQEINQKLDAIASWATPEPPPTPTKARSEIFPTIHVKGALRIMAFDLKNDWVVGPVAINFEDDEGNMVPAPDGAAFTPTMSDATIVNIVMDDGTHYHINALMRRGTVDVVWHEANSLVPDFTETFNVVEDFTPVSAASDFAGADHTTQPLPAA